MAHDSPLRRLDYVLLAAVLALCALGALLVWSATRQLLIDSGSDPQYYLKRHLLNVVLGLAIGTATALFDYRMLRAYAPVVYVASCIGLVAVLGVGATINGAQSWIVLPGGLQVQPSEFAKVALVVGMAMMLAQRRDGEKGPNDRDVMLVLALAAVPLALIMMQPDFGMTMVVLVVVLGMLVLAGSPVRWIVGLVLAAVVVAVGAVQLHVLEDYQVARFAAFTDPEAAPDDAGYTTQQARIAIGSGGLTGKGLFEGTQTGGRFIPEQHTDFIFTVAGEELGLVGAGGIIVLFGVVLLRGVRIAQRAEDTFGALVAGGVVVWFTFQTFVNLGMTLGIMPVTGLPLPFVSYGGSSMFAVMMAVGLLQNVHMRSTAARP